jgi:hypothetical protein
MVYVRPPALNAEPSGRPAKWPTIGSVPSLLMMTKLSPPLKDPVGRKLSVGKVDVDTLPRVTVPVTFSWS